MHCSPQNGGNSNCGNTANKFFLNASKSAKILHLPKLLLVLTWRLLTFLNQTHSFPSIVKYKKIAAKAHRLDTKIIFNFI